MHNDRKFVGIQMVRNPLERHCRNFFKKWSEIFRSLFGDYFQRHFQSIKRLKNFNHIPIIFTFQRNFFDNFSVIENWSEKDISDHLLTKMVVENLTFFCSVKSLLYWIVSLYRTHSPILPCNHRSAFIF